MRKPYYRIVEKEYCPKLYPDGIPIFESHIPDYQRAIHEYEKMIYYSDPGPGSYTIVQMFDKQNVLLYQKKIERGTD